MTKRHPPEQPIDQPPEQAVERPRAEPEVFPPGAPIPPRGEERVWRWVSIEVSEDGRRIRLTRPGRFATALTLFAIAAISLALFTAAFAAAVVIVPLAALIIGLLLFYDRIRRFFQSPRR